MVPALAGAQNISTEFVSKELETRALKRAAFETLRAPTVFVQDGRLTQSPSPGAHRSRPLCAPGTALPAFTDSLAIAATILELLAIFSAHRMASSTSFSTGKTLLTRPEHDTVKDTSTWHWLHFPLGDGHTARAGHSLRPQGAAAAQGRFHPSPRWGGALSCTPCPLDSDRCRSPSGRDRVGLPGLRESNPYHVQ